MLIPYKQHPKIILILKITFIQGLSNGSTMEMGGMYIQDLNKFLLVSGSRTFNCSLFCSRFC